MRQILFILLIITGMLSCAKDQPAPQVLKTSEQKLHFSGNEGAWQLTVNSNTIWQVTGTTDWCSVDKPDGARTDLVVISVAANTTNQPRSTRLLIQGDRSQAEVFVQQDTISGTHHYELPVIFHIFYNDALDTAQNIKTEVIESLIEQCNDFYSNNVGSINMNMQLVPATVDPEGNTLPQPGIERILRSRSAEQSCNSFMQSTNSTDAPLLWNPNEYINVFIYKFTESNTLGISHLPYTPRESSLEGLQKSNVYFTQMPNYPHCISLNSAYLYQETAYKTLAHELGHYLGLFHVFSKTDCSETDYCDDTESYNRQEYEIWLSEHKEASINEQYVRTSCNGGTFISYNIMDYDMSHLSQFTNDQFKRIRHVLENSPLVPGPKNVIITKSLADEPLPPVRTLE